MNEKHKAATKTLLLLVATIAVAVAPRTAAAQTQDGTPADPSPDQNQDATGSSTPSTLENTVEAGISEEAPRRKLVHWNEYHGPYFKYERALVFWSISQDIPKTTKASSRSLFPRDTKSETFVLSSAASYSPNGNAK